MDFTRFRQEQWKKISHDNFSFLKSIPSSYVRSNIALFEKEKDLFTPEVLQKMIEYPDRVSREFKTAQFIFQSIVETNSLEFKPINEIKSIVKNRLKKCNDPKKKKHLEEIADQYHAVYTPGSTRKPIFVNH